jgi:hypothetical protein
MGNLGNLHSKNYSREFRARRGVPQDHNLPAAEFSRIIGLELSERDWIFPAAELSPQSLKFQPETATFR